MSFLLAHLVVFPVVLPLVSAAVLVILGEKRKRFKSRLNVTATLSGLAVALALLLRVDGDATPSGITVYLASNWEAPFGIVLVVDRLSALMLVLVGVVSSCAALYAEARWARAGVYFHALFQIQLMGLNGAFLTGDLFNLFVFFEVMLAASYGLQLHGSGLPRVRSGLHYVAVNLLASSLFLVGLAVLYGVLGTLSMADVAAKLALVPERDRGLMHAGVAILAVAFLVKAAIWPLNSWLVAAYAAAGAPVAALFAVMTKVGIYTLLRLWTLFFSPDIGGSPNFGRPLLFYAGLATVAFGVFGLLASLRLGRIAGFSIIVSSGTLLAAIGLGVPLVTSAALFYLASATLSASALFLLVELVERIGEEGVPQLLDDGLAPGEDTNLDDEAAPLVGRAFPISIALLALAFFASALLVAGLPPLSGFVAKLSLLTAIVRNEGDAGSTTTGGFSPASWMMLVALLVSGLAATVSLVRAGIKHLWSTGGRFALELHGVEAAAVVGLIVSCLGLSVWAEPVLRYTNAAARGLHAPASYINAVSSTKARPGPTQATPTLEGGP